MDAFFRGAVPPRVSDLPPGLLHPWKIGRRKLELFPITRLRAIGAILVVKVRADVRSVFDLLPEAIKIELR